MTKDLKNRSKKISAIVIAYNEEKMISDCLKSLEWVDELLVIDNGSTDKTSEIAKKTKARVINYSKGHNFSEVRNYGLNEAEGEWVLYIDADERITLELKEEIKDIIGGSSLEQKKYNYAIPRKNVILGKELTHGGWYPDYVKRLFLKTNLQKWSGDLHEEPEYIGEIKHLTNPMTHIKHESFAEMIEKTNKWSGIEAQLMFSAGHPPMTIPRFLSAMTREFWKRMIIKVAFLDGPEGIMFAMYQVYSRFISYAKLWELQQKK